MPIEPKQFKPARREGRRLNTAKILRNVLVQRLVEKNKLKEHKSNIILKTRRKRDDRDYFWFKENFEPYLTYFFGKSISLLKILEVMYFAKNRTLRIADYGGANGYVVSDIAKIARHNGLYNDVLVDAEVVDARKRPEDFVGNYTESIVEEHVFDKPVDVLFDNFGPLSYTDFDLRKGILLKHLESLSKGGMLFCSFQFFNREKGTKFIYGKHIIVGNEKYFEDIEKAMSKRGFKAKFYRRRNEDNYKLLDVFLVAQRNDEFPNKNRTKE